MIRRLGAYLDTLPEWVAFPLTVAMMATIATAGYAVLVLTLPFQPK